MPLRIWTGMHWCSPTLLQSNYRSEFLLRKADRWASVVIVGPGGDANARDAMDRIVASNPPGVGLSQSVARLYYPGNPTFLDFASADAWIHTNYTSDLDYFVGRGGRNVVVLNEPDIDHKDLDPRTLGLISQALRNAYWNGGNRLLYTLFPGPSAHAKDNPTGWNVFWDKWEMRPSGGAARTFDQAFGQVDPMLQGKYMLWHSGQGVFDRVGLHAYAYSPTEFATNDPAGNRALYQVQAMQQIDPSGWNYLTECSGASERGFDEAAAGSALADFQYNVDGRYYPFAQAVYGYILALSNAQATTDFKHLIDCNFTDAYVARRVQLGF